MQYLPVNNGAVIFKSLTDPTSLEPQYNVYVIAFEPSSSWIPVYAEELVLIPIYGT